MSSTLSLNIQEQSCEEGLCITEFKDNRPFAKINASFSLAFMSFLLLTAIHLLSEVEIVPRLKLAWMLPAFVVAAFVFVKSSCSVLRSLVDKHYFFANGYLEVMYDIPVLGPVKINSFRVDRIIAEWQENKQIAFVLYFCPKEYRWLVFRVLSAIVSLGTNVCVVVARRDINASDYRIGYREYLNKSTKQAEIRRFFPLLNLIEKHSEIQFIR